MVFVSSVDKNSPEKLWLVRRRFDQRFPEKDPRKQAVRCESGAMKTILALIAIALIVVVQSGCTSRVGASVGHDGHRHGISAKGSTEDGVSGGIRTY